MSLCIRQMPVTCSTSATALTGSDGLVMISPAGTHLCLRDSTDFPAGTDITLGSDHDFRVGDPVVFKAEDGGKLDTAITAGTTYYVISLTGGKAKIATSKGGTAITLNGDGGGVGSGIASVAVGTAGAGYANGTYTNVTLKQGANVSAKATVTVAGGVPTVGAITTPGTGYTTGAGSISLAGGDNGSGVAIDGAAPTTAYAGTPTLTASSDSAGHVNMAYSLSAALCGVKEWSLELSRDSIDVTTLPCKVGNASKYAGFKSSLGGFASGEGSMTVLMTKGTSQANRLLANSLYKNSTAKVKLYLEAGVAAGGGVDDTTSNYIEANVSLQGFSTGVNVDDAVECEISFALLGTPDVLFGVKL